MGVEPALLADTTLTVEVFFGASSEQVTLTDRASSQELRFTASTLGLLEVSARAVDVEPEGLVVAASATETVEVLAEGVIALTLDAPPSVTVGNTFTVTVGVAEGTPLSENTTLTATISFPEGTTDSTEQVVELTRTMSSVRLIFTAPVMAGTFTVEVSGEVSGGTVLGASASVNVEPVALVLVLGGPDEVTVGQDYQVTVQTDEAVPAGTTLEVTVSAGIDMREVLLTAAIPSTEVSFTAPASTGQVMVTAMATPNTAVGALAVTVSDAQTLPVTVSAQVVQEVQLTLEELDPVITGSTVKVTVGVEPALLAETRLTVEVTFGEASSERVILSDKMSSQSLSFTAPDKAGLLEVSARAVDVEPEGLVVAASVTQTVEVRAKETVVLTLAAPTTVTVGETFAVTVRVSEETPLPEGAMVMVTVIFNGEMPGSDLMVNTASAILSFVATFKAPSTSIGTFEVDAVATMISVTNPDALVLNVDPASTEVEVVPVKTMLTLMTPRPVVSEGEMLPVTVGVAQEMPPLPPGTVVEVTVQFFGSDSMKTVTLTASDPTATTMIMAPSMAGQHLLTASATVQTIGDLAVAVNNAKSVTVRVTELVTLELTLSTPSAAVEAGSTFSVTVGTDEPVPEGTTVAVTVTFDGSMQTETLSADQESTTPVMFTAPGTTTGIFTVTAMGTPQVTDPNVLLLTVNPTTALVEVVPVPTTLTLVPSSLVVNAGASLSVEVGTDRNLPAGTEVEVMVQLGSTTDTVTLSATTMPTASLAFTAPPSGPPPSGLLDLTAVVVVVTQSSPVVAVSAPAPVMVQVRQLVTLGLMLSTPSAAVEAGSTFSVTVQTDRPVPEGATVEVTVTFDGSTQTATLLAGMTAAPPVIFTAPGTTTGDLIVDASGEATVDEEDELRVTVNPTSAEVVVVEMSIELTLDAPGRVDGGSTFMATVGTDDVLPAGTEVNVAVQFGEATRTVTLSGASTATAAVSVVFTAPPSGQLDLTAEVTEIRQGDTDTVVTVSDAASVPVQVRQLLTIQLTLENVPMQVEARGRINVTVATNQRLPRGAEATVMVTLVSEDPQSLLTPLVERVDVFFTAPYRQGKVTVTVEAITSTIQVADPDILRLTLLPASTQVLVVPAPRRLVLTPASMAVVEGTTLSVEVGTAGSLPDGAEVEVTVRLGSGSESTVMLTADSPTADAMITAPDADENMQMQALSASGTVRVQGDLDVILVDATPVVFVRVREVGTIGLTLSVPEEVEAGSTFSVEVATDVPVPPTADIPVMVSFDGSTQPALLSADEATATVMFTAPGRPTGTYTVDATTGTTGTELSVVDPASASVVVVPVAITLTLTLTFDSLVVDAGGTLSVEVDTNRALPEGTVVNVEVQFGEEQPQTETVTLSTATPSDSVEFTAPEKGLLDLTAEVIDIQQSEIVVAVSDALPVPVQVTELRDIMLTVSAQPSVVTVGNTFMVTVGVSAETPLPDDTTAEVMAVFEGVTVPVTLSGEQSETVQFTAPVTSGTFTVEVSGSVEATDALRLTVIDATASVTVEALTVALMLSGPEEVTVGQDYQVTVAADVPEGTTLVVMVSAGTAEPQTVLLTGNASEQVPFMAPARAGDVEITATVEDDEDVQTAEGALEVAVSDAEPLTVNVAALDVQLVLSDLPLELVAAGSTFPVTVGTEPEVPAGRTVTVTVTVRLADFSSEPVALTPDAPTARVVVTAPADGGSVLLIATGMPAASNRLELNVLEAQETVRVQQRVQLTLAVPARATAREEVVVTVGVSPALLAGTVLTVEVAFGEATQQITLSDTMPERMVTFTAPDVSTSQLVVVSARQTAVEPEGLVAASVTRTVEVLAAGTVALTLAAPTTVMVGELFVVTVGVAEGTRLPTGATVTAVVSLESADVEVVLTSGAPTATASVTAPVTAGDFTVTVRGSADDASINEVRPASAQVTVEPVAVEVQLSGPSTVTVGEDYTVQVDTDMPVPEGTTVTVTVTANNIAGEPPSVLLTADIRERVVTFTAPDVVGIVMVTAVAMSDTAAGFLEVAVPAEATLDVTVQQEVQLTLAVSQGIVNFDSVVEVIVGVEPVLLPDTMLTVSVTFGAALPQQVTLTNTVTSQSLLFMASDAGEGDQEVIAQMVAVEPAGLVEAASASTSVEVLAEGTVVLTLAVPNENVTVGATFTVTVGVLEKTPLPEGTTLTATVSFAAGTADSTEQVVVLTPGMSSDALVFTAPVMAGTVTVEVNGATDDNIAILFFINTSAQVTVEPVAVEVQLRGPSTVTVGEDYQVTVSTQPEVPAGTTLTVTVSDGPDMREVLLTAAIPSTEVSFTAPARAGDVEITATVEDDEDVQTAEGSLEVAVSDAAPLAVMVAAEQVQLALRLEAPAQVEVGSTFRVTVATDEPVPEGATVAVTVVFDGADSEPVMLSAERTTAAVTLTAPGTTTGTFTVAATGTATVADDSVLQVTVMDASTEVDVVAQQLTLTLTVMPDPVNVGGQLVVTVGLSPALLVAATLTVAVTFDDASPQQVTLSDTASSQPVTFIPLEAGMLEVRAQMMGAAEPLGLVEAAMATQTVRVREAGTIGLTLVVPEEPVEAGSTFPVTVGTDLPMLLATTATVQVMVTLAGGSTQIRTLSAGSETATVMFMAPGSPTRTYTVNAIGMGTTPVMTVEAANTSVTVVPVAIALMLRAPEVVAAGSTFSVEVGTEPALPAGTMVDLIVQIVQIDGAFSASRTVTLSGMTPSIDVDFMAPESGQLPLTAEVVVVGITQSSPVVVISAPPPVEEIPVSEQATVRLILAVLEEMNGQFRPVPVERQPAQVEAGRMFRVMLTAQTDTNMPLPSETIVEIIVTFEGSTQKLAITASSFLFFEYISPFMAPGTTGGPFEVVARGQRDVSNELRVLPSTASVVVVPAMIDLTLTAPRVVNGGSTFMATVGTESPLPAGTEVDLIVRIVQIDRAIVQIDGAFSATRTVTLSGMTPSDSVDFMAPPSGRLELTAEMSTVRGTIETEIANPATVTVVQVTELITLGLTLSTPSVAVEAGSTFRVTVQTDRPVPAESEVQLVVTFDGSTQTPMLPAGTTAVTVVFAAPGTTGTSTVNASGEATVTNADALRVMVNPTSTEVVVGPAMIELTLTAPRVVDGGGTFMATVGVGPNDELPAGTEVEVMVQLDSTTGTVTTDTVRLTEMMPTASLEFTAPPSGLLDLTAEVTGIQQGDTAVTVSDAAPVPVQVTELITLGLTLSTPSTSVEAGNTFSVTVQTDRPVPEGADVLVTVTFAGSTQTETLLAGETMATVMFMAPGSPTGTFTVDATGASSVTDANVLQLTVTSATASVEVVPVPTTLTLTAPDSVDGGDTLTATVVAQPALPVGTMVNLMVQFGEAIRTVTLSGTTVSVTFTAPPSGPPPSGLLDLTAVMVGVTQSSPVVAVSAPAPVSVQITELVTVALTLTPELPMQDGEPFNVMVGSTFTVMVATNPLLPPVGVEVTVTVTFADSLQTARLSARAASGILDFRAIFTAPSTRTGTFEVNAFGTPNEITLGALRLMISTASINVMVKPVPISLTLTPISSLDALAGDSVSVEVGTDRPLPTGTVVDVIVQLGSETETVTLSPMMTTMSVALPAPLSAGEHQLTASGTVVTQGDFAASVAAAETLTVTVQTEGIVLLTLAAQENMTVGATFTVTVGVNAETPLPEDTEVTVAVISQTTDGVEIERQEVMLTPEMPSATRSFTAPATAGSFMLTTIGTEDTDAIRVVVDASTQVSAEAVALTLILSAPREVTVGSTYQVTVETDEAVPAGTMLEVTVSAGTEAPQTVMLTEDNPSRAVLFTAPPRAPRAPRADIVTVTATATVDTAPDALQVATPAAATRAVTVSAQQVQLVLSDLPSGLVAAGSTFTVTVGTVSGLPEDTAVTVTVSLAGGASEPVAVDLTPSNLQAPVVVTAPDTGGPALLMATGIPAEDNRLELNVLAAETTIVQVQVQAQLSLQLEAPGVVTARDTFAVRVSAEPEVPEGATVTVIVTFEAESEPVTLSAGTTSAVVMLTAPGRLAENLELSASGSAVVVDRNVLQVTVTPPNVALVNVVPQQVQLMLDVPDEVMTGTSAAVMVSVSPAPLAETTLTVVVTFGESTQQVILSDTTLSQMVSFPAPTAALLDVRAEAVAVEPTGGLVVATEAMMQTVQVIELRDIRLTVSAQPNVVTVGSTFTVTVRVNAATPLPEGTQAAGMVVFADVTRPVTLHQGQSTGLVFTAPVTAGTFTVAVSGSVEETDALRVTVMEATALVRVEPVAVALVLSRPEPAAAVTVGSTYQVTVRTDEAVPQGTTLVVTVRAGTQEPQTPTVMLTAANPSENVPFTAPTSAGIVMVTATVENDESDVQTAEGSLRWQCRMQRHWQ